MLSKTTSIISIIIANVKITWKKFNNFSKKKLRLLLDVEDKERTKCASKLKE